MCYFYKGRILSQIYTVLSCAGAYVMNDGGTDSLLIYQKHNTQIMLALIRKVENE